jgi:hypothetical protein
VPGSTSGLFMVVRKGGGGCGAWMRSIRVFKSAALERTARRQAKRQFVVWPLCLYPPPIDVAPRNTPSLTHCTTTFQGWALGEWRSGSILCGRGEWVAVPQYAFCIRNFRFSFFIFDLRNSFFFDEERYCIYFGNRYLLYNYELC